MKADTEQLNFILLPGLDGTGILAQPFVKQFPYPERLEVITYPQSIKNNSLSQLAKMIEDKLIDKKNYVLIGESFGGLVCLEILKRNFLTLKGMIFLVAFAQPPKPRLLKLLEKLPIEYFPWASLPNFILKQFAISSDATQEQVELAQTTSKSVDPKTLAHRLRIIISDPMKDIDNHWSIPCLYIQGSEDKVVPKHSANWFKKHFSNFTLNSIKGGHFLLHTRTQECIDNIVNFEKILTNSKPNHYY